MYILRAKSLLFLMVVALSLVHDFWLGPKILERLDQAAPLARSYPKAWAAKSSA